MPWILSVLLIVFVPLLIVTVWVGRVIADSLVLLTRWKRKTVIRWVAIIGFVLNSFPVLFLVVLLVGGQSRVPAFSGENFFIDLVFVYPFWFTLVIVVQCFLVLLVARIIRLLLFPVFRRKKERWFRVEAWSFLAIAAFLSCYSIIVIVQDTWSVRVVQESIPVPAKARGLAGKKMVLISDVQGDARTDGKALRSYVDRINTLQPDLVLFAGDLVTSGERYIESTAKIMGAVVAPLGKIAAIGDHDMFSNRDSVVKSMEKHGYLIADDSTITLNMDSTTVCISLVTNTYLRRPKSQSLEKLLSSTRSADFRIVLVHQPAEELVQFAEAHHYDLFLAGHTHGGGIAFGIRGVMLVAPANLESRYVSGFYNAGPMAIVVTNGLGLTLTPIRFHAPAEITVLNFVLTSQS